MIKFENTVVRGWALEEAIRELRESTNSSERSDSQFGFGAILCKDCINSKIDPCGQNCISIGPNDASLISQLQNAGTDYKKFMQMVTGYTDIIAPLYFWEEFSTYKVGTVALSYFLFNKKFTLEDFSCENLSDGVMSDVFQNKSPLDILYSTIDMLNLCRDKYLETKDEKYWWQITKLLPYSYNQKKKNTVQLLGLGYRLQEFQRFRCR